MPLPAALSPSRSPRRSGSARRPRRTRRSLRARAGRSCWPLKPERRGAPRGRGRGPARPREERLDPLMVVAGATGDSKSTPRTPFRRSCRGRPASQGAQTTITIRAAPSSLQRSSRRATPFGGFLTAGELSAAPSISSHWLDLPERRLCTRKCVFADGEPRTRQNAPGARVPDQSRNAKIAPRTDLREPTSGTHPATTQSWAISLPRAVL